MNDSHTTNKLNKSLVTNLVAACCVACGYLLQPPLSEPVLNIGLYALSGALTNWLAIHMLFEKVPGLYGSGVIPARFEDFKSGIHNLIMNQFFTKENVERMLAGSSDSKSPTGLNLDPIIDQTDISPAFNTLVTTIMESPFGEALNMFGGAAALEPLKPSFSEKMKVAFKDIANSDSFQKILKEELKGTTPSDEIINKVGAVVQKRLNELTPQLVKEIIQEMIKKHLGWLVVWGGVFGGLIGLITTYLPKSI